MKATKIKDVGVRPTGATQSLYRLDPPLEGHELVVVSALDMDLEWTHVIETYIFPADINGEITDFGELPGSYRGGLDHTVALKRAGYEVVT